MARFGNCNPTFAVHASTITSNPGIPMLIKLYDEPDKPVHYRTGTCSVSAVIGSDHGSEGERWEIADIKRAAKAIADRLAGKRDCGYPVKLPRSDKTFALAATGAGLTWGEADGRTMRAQVWSPGPYARSYWLKVREREARFPGEMRLTYADADGNLSAPDGKVYNAQGESHIHTSDGSVCYGGQNSDVGWVECSGCKRERIASMIGKYVRVTVTGDPMYGSTCRWGTLREITDGRAVFDDDLADCSGIRTHPSCRGFKLDEIHEIKLCTRAA